jgi:hypothetical protein
MKYTYGVHAKARIVEREIPLDAIDFLLSPKAPKLTVPSKTDPEIDLILGVYEGKAYAIIVNHHSYKIVTVRRARANEEKQLKGEGFL